MEIRNVRLSKRTKDQLSRLKRKTSIPTYNVLCRWALCHSLSGSESQTVQYTKSNDAPDSPIGLSQEEEKILEIDWRVLGGEYCDVFVALISQTCIETGIEIDSAMINKQIKLHIETGVKQLVANDDIKNIESLLSLVTEDQFENGKRA